jgi:hypothetical protein
VPWVEYKLHQFVPLYYIYVFLCSTGQELVLAWPNISLLPRRGSRAFAYAHMRTLRYEFMCKVALQLQPMAHEYQCC